MEAILVVVGWESEAAKSKGDVARSGQLLDQEAIKRRQSYVSGRVPRSNKR